MSTTESPGVRRRRRLVGAGIFVLLAVVFWRWGYPWMFERYTGVVNAPLTYASSQRVTDAEFDALADELTQNWRLEQALLVAGGEKDEFARRVKVNMLMKTRSFKAKAPFPHIDYFRKAGIRVYEGPRTCLTCHETISVRDAHGESHRVGTLEDVVDSVHFKFQRSAPGFSTYGYDGREVNAEGSRPIPVGKIDRACGVPGSFSWTGWAELVDAKPARGAGEVEVRSEGCGQCHIGGGYHPATEKMMPIGDVPAEIKEGIDCLICHATAYDMNQRTVIEDGNGRRWNQDRSLKSALTVGNPGYANCMLCHQHNMGGDQEKDLPANAAPRNLGYENKRLLHPGAKRANSITAENDVHVAAGMTCTDCHTPQGHKIPRGTKGVDLVANDLPGQEVTCEGCHTAAPHVKSADRAILNGHGDRLACETCHIHRLRDDNVVLRDWIHPVWNEEEGVYVFVDVLQTGEPGQGFKYLWFNGNGTFLANALGDNPMGGEGYNPLMSQMVVIDHPEAVAKVRAAALKLKESYPDLDVDRYVREATTPLSQLSPERLAERERMIRENLRSVMRQGKSKITPFKIFNAIMYEDMSNQGPFGAMILPFDYPTYYETGDSLGAMRKALEHPIVKRMYQLPFKGYMMDEFMSYFGVAGWSGIYPLTDGGELRNVEAHWMRQMGTLMINHGIQRQGRGCRDCHAPNGIIDFAGLGYPEERIRDLVNPPELVTMGR
ncbi:MAG: nitrite reductase [Magnetococcales bacterium]|nr:nitrite reductase [Magnetococcales bacterium]MBF0155593.1 nitrite reductase [Magnetococcales bacterium]